jgi:hypothetical protein
MYLVYVFGPFTEKTPWDTHLNVVAAELIGAQVANSCDNVMPIIPHCNSENMVGIQDGVYWTEGTKELMRRCDCLLAVPCDSEKMKKSVGSQGEIAEATRLSIPIFYNLDDLIQWSLERKDEDDGNTTT